MFTIITVSYNQAKYLEQCILSILNQDVPVEHIIIDGGSIDGSIEIIRKYEDKITYWVSEKDKGPSNALNKGLEIATGTYIGYINSDDYLLPGALTAAKKAIENHPGFDVYYGSGIIVNESNHTTNVIHPTRWHLGVYRSGLTVMFQQSSFIRRECFDHIQFNESNTTHWDGELLVDLSLANAKFYRFNKVVAAFRIHNLSITGGVLGAEGHSTYNQQMDLVNQKIDLLRPKLIKSFLFWMCWLIITDAGTMINRMMKKIFPGSQPRLITNRVSM